MQGGRSRPVTTAREKRTTRPDKPNTQTDLLKKTLLSLTLGALLFAGVSATSYAQEVTPNGAVDPGHPRVNQVDSRERRQDSRIANGDRSGQLTNRETANVDRRENNIQNSKALDQAGHHGHLTKREQNRLNRRQNRLSRTIHRDKHNRRVRG